MRIGCRIPILLALLSCLLPAAQAEPSIFMPAMVPTPVRHAAHRLSEYTGIPIDNIDNNAKDRFVRLEVNGNANPKIGTQGYGIRTSSRDVIISANTGEGPANGVYTLLRTLMIEHGKDPFSKTWSIEEAPHFTFRAMEVAPYRFGGSYGFAELSPDRWSIDDWMIAVGTTIADCPPHGPGRALISASGSYLG
jgi:hypothetical protein